MLNIDTIAYEINGAKIIYLKIRFLKNLIYDFVDTNN